MWWNKKPKYKKSFEKVAEFWAENTFRKKMNMNNGDTSSSGAITAMLGNMASMKAQSKVNSDQVEKFKSILVKKLEEAYNKHNKLWSVQLFVDYGPCTMLAEAAEEAGIKDLNSFPWKSNSWIEEDGTVNASLGYHGTPKIL